MHSNSVFSSFICVQKNFSSYTQFSTKKNTQPTRKQILLGNFLSNTCFRHFYLCPKEFSLLHTIFTCFCPTREFRPTSILGTLGYRDLKRSFELKKYTFDFGCEIQISDEKMFKMERSFELLKFRLNPSRVTLNPSMSRGQFSLIMFM